MGNSYVKGNCSHGEAVSLFLCPESILPSSLPPYTPLLSFPLLSSSFFPFPLILSLLASSSFILMSTRGALNAASRHLETDNPTLTHSAYSLELWGMLRTKFCIQSSREFHYLCWEKKNELSQKLFPLVLLLFCLLSIFCGFYPHSC